MTMVTTEGVDVDVRDGSEFLFQDGVKITVEWTTSGYSATECLDKARLKAAQIARENHLTFAGLDVESVERRAAYGSTTYEMKFAVTVWLP